MSVSPRGASSSAKVSTISGRRQLFLAAIALFTAASLFAMQINASSGQSPHTAPFTAAPPPQLLSDPFLQRPTNSTVQVVWFTEFEGRNHHVVCGSRLVQATTTKLSRTREDGGSYIQSRAYSAITPRDVWRHEATVSGLEPGLRQPYYVTSEQLDGQTVSSRQFTLAPNPAKGQPLKILLTSDHQLKPMTPANLQKVAETIGSVDAVFFAGDLVNIPDRASEWFDDARELAFFPALQGRVRYEMNANEAEESAVYTGGELIQHAPLFPTIGNHEVMGRYAEDAAEDAAQQTLKAEFSNTLPRQLVSRFYSEPEGNHTQQSKDQWIKDHSYNTDTYQEIFSLPKTPLPSGEQTEQYYAVTFGDIRLVSLYVTQVWRSPSLSPNTKGRYRENNADLSDPKSWGYGQHIFEPIRKGSVQYDWLAQELASDEFKNARYKIVMLHHPPHTLGGNIVPAFTDPVPVEMRDETGKLTAVQYEYPKEDDYIVRDLLPLLENSEAQLVFYGHSHLWNRFISKSGLHFLETSNVGNSYGAHTAQNPRSVPTPEAARENGLQPFQAAYEATEDPNGLAPIMPAIAPLISPLAEEKAPQPFIASNDITCFTIFETGTGMVTSYYFDTRKPDSAVVKFDEFRIENRSTSSNPKPETL